MPRFMPNFLDLLFHHITDFEIADMFEFTMLIRTRMILNCAMFSPRDRMDRVGGADVAGHLLESRSAVYTSNCRFGVRTIPEQRIS